MTSTGQGPGLLESFVTYRQAITFTLTAMGLAATAYGFHIMRPHEGAVNEREMDIIVQRFDTERLSIDKRFDRFDIKLDKLLDYQRRRAR